MIFPILSKMLVFISIFQGRIDSIFEKTVHINTQYTFIYVDQISDSPTLPLYHFSLDGSVTFLLTLMSVSRLVGRSGGWSFSKKKPGRHNHIEAPTCSIHKNELLSILH